MNYLATLKKLIKAYQKVMALTDRFATNKDEPVKGTSKDWFDAEITEKKQREISYSKTRKNLTCMSIKITIRKQGMGCKN